MGQSATTRRTMMNMADVVEITSLSKPTIYRYIKDGSFPRPVKLGKRRVAWNMAAINEWMEGLTV